MADSTRKLFIPAWRRLRFDRRDAVIAAWSLLLHLLIFLLLPQLTTVAAARTELQIDIVRKEPRPRAAASRQQPSSPQQAVARSEESPPIDTPVDSEQAMKTPEAARTDASAGESAQAGESPAAELPAPATMPADPDVITTPTHQPKTVEKPVEAAAGPPEAAASKTEPAKPPQPDSASKEKPAEPVKSEQPEVKPEHPSVKPAPDTADDSTPAKPDQPEGQPDDATGADVPQDGPPAPPPGPSQLELGLLKDYGDYARGKIRKLARTPERAREQNLKGKVTFEFEIASDGTLVSVKIANSSGHPVLDEECIEATRVAGPFRRFPAGIKVSSWIFRMELDFPLY